MVGLFGTLNLASRSLSVQQEATAVAGQNLANVGNAAYSRQQLQIQAATPLETPDGEEGTGVEAVQIVQVRSALLDSQIQAEGSVSGSVNAQQSALENAQAQLGEQLSSTTSSASATSPDGITADMSSLFASMQNLSTDPSNLSDRQTLVQSAQQLTQQFNQVSSGLSTLRSNLNTSITSDTSTANQDLTNIASLNQQIMVAQASGSTANDLVDMREQSIEDLASKVNITTTADTNGAVDIAVGNVTMVSGGSQADSLETYDAGGGQILLKAQNAGTPLTVTGGSIGGNIDTRDGALASLQGSVDTLASQLITQVNTVYASGYDLNGNTGQSFFTGTDAASIGVNSNLVTDPSTLQASGTPGATGDNTVVLAMAQLANQSISGLNNQTFSQNYAQTVSTLGSALSSVNEQVANSSAVSQMLTQQRDSVSGVSTDEEMTNLMQFQKAYEASAQLITTVNEMLATVIAMKTV